MAPLNVARLLEENSVRIDRTRIEDVRDRLFGPRKRRSPEGYELEELIGRGRFGRVYRALDLRLDRRVAIKLIRYRNEVELARVKREAQALARISHPNVVQVYDQGDFDKGVYFIALEYVQGIRLDVWSCEASSTREILEVFVGVAHGLLAAHEAGLVHRDFKPSNVLVGEGPQQRPQPRLLDFGLAKFQRRPDDQPGRPSESSEHSTDHSNLRTVRSPHAGTSSAPSTASDTEGLSWQSGPYEDEHPSVDGPSDEGLEAGEPQSSSLSTRLTAKGGFVGTPRYAAPEQFGGADVDSRSDQFSYCVALWEAVYGYAPFTGETASQRSANIEIGPKSEARSAHRVPSWLRKILVRGLSPDIDDRFTNIAQIIDKIELELKRPPLARRVATWGLAVAASLAMIFMATVPSGTFERVVLTREVVAPQRYQLTWEHQIIEASYGPALEEQLVHYADVLDRIGRLTPANQLEAVACLERSREAFEGLTEALEAEERPSAPSSLGVPDTLWLSRLRDPRLCITAGFTANGLSPNVVKLLIDAQIQQLKGNYEASLQLAEQVRQSVPRTSLPNSMAMFQRSSIELLTNDDQGAWATASQALVESLGTEGNIDFFLEFIAKALEAGVDAGVDAAVLESYFEAAKVQLRAHRRQRHEVAGLIYLAAGHIAFRDAQYDKALSRYEQARKILEHLHDGDDFRVASAKLHEAFAKASLELEVAKLAPPAAAAALDDRRRTFGRRHPLIVAETLSVGQTFQLVAFSIMESGSDPELALDYLRQAEGYFKAVEKLSSRSSAEPSFDRLRAQGELLSVDSWLIELDGRTRDEAWRDSTFQAAQTLERALLSGTSSSTRGKRAGKEAQIWKQLTIAYAEVEHPRDALGPLDEWHKRATPADDQYICLVFSTFDAEMMRDLDDEQREIVERMKVKCPNPS